MTNHSPFPGQTSLLIYGASVLTLGPRGFLSHETFSVKTRKVLDKPGQTGHRSWRNLNQRIRSTILFSFFILQSFTGTFQWFNLFNVHLISQTAKLKFLAMSFTGLLVLHYAQQTRIHTQAFELYSSFTRNLRRCAGKH